ncbi:MAG: hypothetical protein PHZ02_03240 [Desulfocapsaceae bacterium]|nr:hypothetical protein [Desulfocapsaceae bacterium]
MVPAEGVDPVKYALSRFKSNVAEIMFAAAGAEARLNWAYPVLKETVSLVPKN